MLKFINRSEGFTLIELMIVILIIAILIAIAVPVFLAQQTKARRSTCQANLRTIDSAVMSYQSAAEVYPANIAAMVAAGNNQALKTTPTCPAGSVPKNYTWYYGGDSAPGYAKCPFVSDHTI